MSRRSFNVAGTIPSRENSAGGFQLPERRKGEKGMVKNSVWINEVIDDRLSELARANNTSKQQLFLKALDLLFTEFGEPSVGDLTAKWKKIMDERARGV